MDSKTPDALAIQSWSSNYISKFLNVPSDRIDSNSDFDGFGLDSSSAVAYIMSLEEWLGIELMPELLFEYTTIAALSEHLVTLLSPAETKIV